MDIIKNLYHFIKNNNKIKFGVILLLLSTFVILFAVRNPVKLFAQDNDDCMMCHEDKTLTGKKGKRTVSMYIDKKKLQKSIHAGLKCVDCHIDLKNADLPHNDDLKPPYCGNCHKDQQSLFNDCMHGKAHTKGDPLAPSCWTCHGNHDILGPKDKKSTVYPLNIPHLCGRCHREGSPVQLQRNIPQTHILENYS